MGYDELNADHEGDDEFVSPLASMTSSPRWGSTYGLFGLGGGGGGGGGQGDMGDDHLRDGEEKAMLSSSFNGADFPPSTSQRRYSNYAGSPPYTILNLRPTALILYLSRIWILFSPILVIVLLVIIVHLSYSNLNYKRNSILSQFKIGPSDPLDMYSINKDAAGERETKVEQLTSVVKVCEAMAGVTIPFSKHHKDNKNLDETRMSAEESAIATSTTNALNLVGRYDLAIDRHLTNQQCDAVFPGLYFEIDRAIEYYSKRGGLNMSDLDAAETKGQARGMIYNNRLYVKSYSSDQQGTRTKAIFASINEALITSLEAVPDIEFVVQTGDTGMPTGAPWALGRKASEEQLVLMPDYGFYSWPEPAVNSFLEVQDKTLLYESKLKWKDKIPKLFWRGAMMVDIRKEFWDIANDFSWGAVSDLDWSDKSELKDTLLTPEEHCQYKFLGHVEGWAYSGRLKYLQQCRSVIVAHKMQYIQHFHHLFNSDAKSPDQNIVVSPGYNFDELPKVMDALLKDDARAERIANTSYHFFRRWLSPASIDCYWRRLFHRWAEIQNFEPQLYRDTTSFNSFSLLGKTKWEPY